ncbi:uncharacterized protein BDZ83DRAFT_129429 [Colletotrichum acutatum]|uniref:Uncharacterized protein n=1 Tax=Glomerella acutata TaxID=27357 RepID=A0AAD8XIX9_GLOAC|nr:uncharacterized protein BDZ83DRAFT_129429 [Colletotrichum acutatum]KAK1728506.1 hypothetical protein BDZ83DRAFT_129429 [Colletotrichum acutatum]
MEAQQNRRNGVDRSSSFRHPSPSIGRSPQTAPSPNSLPRSRAYPATATRPRHALSSSAPTTNSREKLFCDLTFLPHPLTIPRKLLKASRSTPPWQSNFADNRPVIPLTAATCLRPVRIRRTSGTSHCSGQQRPARAEDRKNKISLHYIARSHRAHRQLSALLAKEQYKKSRSTSSKP